jgi:phage terminase large subunit
MFVKNPPPADQASIVEVNWRDNPWLPEELRKEKDYLFAVDPDAAQHVWEGQCNTRSNTQVFYGKYVVEAFEPGDGWHGPYFGQDFGFGVDPAATVKVWITPDMKRVCIEYEAFGFGVKQDDLPALIRTIPGADKHTIRGDCSRPETIVHLVDRGLNVVPCQKWTGCVEDGVAVIRFFEQIVIHPRCTHMKEEARLYRYKVDKITNDILPIIIDKHNHGWDAVRYALEPLIMARCEDTLVVGDDVQISSDMDEAELQISSW